MTEPQDPPRLLDDPGTGELRLGLERMSSNLPSPEALARMAERLGVAPDPTPANGGSPTSSTLAKIAAGVGVSGVVLYALLRGSAPEPAALPSSRAHASPSSVSSRSRRSSRKRAPIR